MDILSTVLTTRQHRNVKHFRMHGVIPASGARAAFAGQFLQLSDKLHNLDVLECAESDINRRSYMLNFNLHLPPQPPFSLQATIYFSIPFLETTK